MKPEIKEWIIFISQVTTQNNDRVEDMGPSPKSRDKIHQIVEICQSRNQS
jgi:hypothetical protein